MNNTNTDPKGVDGLRKPQLQLLPSVILQEMAAALNEGAKKYGRWNWRSDGKVETMTYVGAILRHLMAYVDRIDLDQDSGAHHLGHIAANCAILLDAAKFGSLLDDRPPTLPPTRSETRGKENRKTCLTESKIPGILTALAETQPAKTTRAMKTRNCVVHTWTGIPSKRIPQYQAKFHAWSQEGSAEDGAYAGAIVENDQGRVFVVSAEAITFTDREEVLKSFPLNARDVAAAPQEPESK